MGHAFIIDFILEKKKKALPVFWADVIGNSKHHFKKVKEKNYLCRDWVASAVMFLGDT